MTTHQSTPPPVEPSDLPTPGAKRWQMLRAGIQNLWEYDDQRFVFERGRLLLRGRNESGKTKAIEVLLPFLLDANLAPARLDPFGSTARSMRWNLINEDTPSSTNISVGYVWIEFGIDTDLGPRYFHDRRRHAGEAEPDDGRPVVLHQRAPRRPRARALQRPPCAAL